VEQCVQPVTHGVADESGYGHQQSEIDVLANPACVGRVHWLLHGAIFIGVLNVSVGRAGET